MNCPVASIRPALLKKRRYSEKFFTCGIFIEMLFVSVTSTSCRLNLLRQTIESLKEQTFKDFQILIFLSHEPYLRDKGIAKKPSWLSDALTKVLFTTNFGSYRKLAPALSLVDSEDIIVTVDDDVVFDKCFLEKMFQASCAYPDSIVCSRARELPKGALAGKSNYYRWKQASDLKECFLLVPIGVGGVAYRKKLLCETFISDHTFVSLAPTADDLWFRMASMLTSAKVVVDPRIESLNLPIDHGYGLVEVNGSKPTSKSFFERGLKKLLRETKTFLGLPATPYDCQWRKILCYARNNYGFKGTPNH